MMKIVRNLTQKLFLSVLIVLSIFTSCSEEQLIEGSPNIKNEGNGKTIIFSIHVPSGSQTERSATRALSDDQENEITGVNVLVFDRSTGKSVYQANGYDIATPNVNQPNIKTFKVDLILDDKLYDLMFLANSTQIINNRDLKGKTKTEVSEMLTASIENAGNSTRWPGDGSRPIPMWGEKNDVILRENTSFTGDNGIKLTRMLARVDVIVEGGVEFGLVSVRVYNWYNAGTVMPTPTNWNASLHKASYPSIPSVAQRADGVGYPQTYYGGDIDRDNNKTERVIYLFEADNNDSGSNPLARRSRTSLVVGGNYGGDANETFYRVDFATKNGNNVTYHDILRNFRYAINVKKVSGPGYKTPEEAFNSEPVNIETEIMVWNESTHEVVFNGQNYIGLSARNVHFNQFANPNTYTIDIETDVESLVIDDVITVTRVDRDGWWTTTAPWKNNQFTVGLNKLSSSRYQLVVTAKPTMENDIARKSTIKLKGANLNVDIDITQDPHTKYKLVTFPDPMNAIMIDGIAHGYGNRIPIEVQSSHDYMFDIPSNVNGTIVNVYASNTTPVESPLSRGAAINKSQNKLWIAVGEWNSIDPRMGVITISHHTSIAGTTAQPATHTILQVKSMLTASILGSNSVAQSGGSVNIEVKSNLSKWVPELWIDGVKYTGNLSTYFDMTQGAGSKTVKFTAGVLSGTSDRIFKIRFKDEAGTIMSEELTVTQIALALDVTPLTVANVPAFGGTSALFTVTTTPANAACDYTLSLSPNTGNAQIVREGANFRVKFTQLKDLNKSPEATVTVTLRGSSLSKSVKVKQNALANSSVTMASLQNWFGSLYPGNANAQYVSKWIESLGSSHFGPSGAFKVSSFINKQGAANPEYNNFVNLRDAGMDIFVYPNSWISNETGNAITTWLKGNKKRFMIAHGDTPEVGDNRLAWLGINGTGKQSGANNITMAKPSGKTINSYKLYEYLYRDGPFTNGEDIFGKVLLEGGDGIEKVLTRGSGSTMIPILVHPSNSNEIYLGIDPQNRTLFIGNQEMFSVRNKASNNWVGTRGDANWKFLQNINAFIFNVVLYGEEFTSQFYETNP